MRLWRVWFEAVAQLRPACTRGRTYCWMVLVLMALSIRGDIAGVTSFVRGLGLAPSAYKPVGYTQVNSSVALHTWSRGPAGHGRCDVL